MMSEKKCKTVEIVENAGFMEIGVFKKEKLEQKYGFLCIVDALGIKNTDKDGIIKFIKDLQTVAGTLENTKKKISDRILDPNVSYIEPQIYTFQDTVIIFLEMDDRSNLGRYLEYFLWLINLFMASSFANNIAFRGAMTYGEFYVYDGKHYLGDAVYDAASWYEEANLIAVMTTPKMTLFLKDQIKKSTKIEIISEKTEFEEKRIFQSRQYLGDLKIQIPEDEFDKPIVIQEIGKKTKTEKKEIQTNPYDRYVTYSNVKTRKNVVQCFLGNWPNELGTHFLPEERTKVLAPDTLSFYYHLCGMFDIKKGTEEKYAMTTSFVETLSKKQPHYYNFDRVQLMEDIKEKIENDENNPK